MHRPKYQTTTQSHLNLWLSSVLKAYSCIQSLTVYQLL